MADDNVMGLKDILAMTAPKDSSRGVGPTEADRPELERLVGVVERGLAAWAEAAAAIGTIKDRQLWRLDGQKTWEQWCEQRLNITPRRVLQLEAAAVFGRELADRLPSKIGSGASDIRLPSSPAALEPLSGLKTTDERVAAYIDAAKASAKGTPTRAEVQRAVAKRKGRRAIPKPRRIRVPGATVVVTYNRKSDGSVVNALQAALRLVDGQDDKAAA